MSSNNTYIITEQQHSNFKPTYLYIKQHSVTGLKYFGKTVRDPYKYNGSGTHWKNHLKKHGKQIETVWVHLFTDIDELVSVALTLSDLFDIVESDFWANLTPENGINGGLNQQSREAMLIMVKQGTHPFQSKQNNVQRVERNKLNASLGLNPFQSKTHKQNTSKRNKLRAEQGLNPFQSKEFIEKQSKIVSFTQKTLIEQGLHYWQSEEWKQENSKNRSEKNKILSSRPLYLEVKQLCKDLQYKMPTGLNLKSDTFLQELKQKLEFYSSSS